MQVPQNHAWPEPQLDNPHQSRIFCETMCFTSDPWSNGGDDGHSQKKRTLKGTLCEYRNGPNQFLGFGLRYCVGSVRRITTRLTASYRVRRRLPLWQVGHDCPSNLSNCRVVRRLCQTAVPAQATSRRSESCGMSSALLSPLSSSHRSRKVADDLQV